jgi:hypothetical protein
VPLPPDPCLDLSKVSIIKQPEPAQETNMGGNVGANMDGNVGGNVGPNVGANVGTGADTGMVNTGVPPGRYVATHNTLYIGGLPNEWSVEQVGEGPG